METALKVTSREGLFVEGVEASQIKSRGMARELGPFVAPDRSQLVTWVSSSWKDSRQIRCSHFRCLPGTSLSVRKQINSFLNEGQFACRPTIHDDCRDALANALRRHLGSPLDWIYKRSEFSDFPFRGDLLRGVKEIRTEYEIPTPFGKDYVLDIALLGPLVNNKPIILGGIELEFTHEMDQIKTLLCKCLGFAIISIDISEFTEHDVEEPKLMRVLTETTTSSADGRRRNFFFLHPCLLPLFLDAPEIVISYPKHHFVIFASKERIPRIFDNLKRLRLCLNLDCNDYTLNMVRPKDGNDPTMAKEGLIAGKNWRNYNTSEYIRVSVPRSTRGNDSNYFFHLKLAEIVNSIEPALVGYKFESPVFENYPESPMWIKQVSTEGKSKDCKICPKHLSNPIDSILDAIESIGTSHHI